MTATLAVILGLAGGYAVACWRRDRRTAPRPWWARDYGQLDMSRPENRRLLGK